MEDFNSKYTGEEVESLLDIVNEGCETTEEDIVAMGFTKNIGTITEVKMNGISKGTNGVVDLGTVITEHQDISGKVDKIEGKQLSTEDFTTTLKTKLENLSNYDDTTINSAISTLRNDLDTLVSGDTTTAIESFNEIIAFLDGVDDSQDLSGIIAAIQQQIASKYTKPDEGIPATDLSSDVQSSLGKANTALQEYVEQYKGTIEAVDTSEEVEDVIVGYATKEYVNSSILSAIGVALNTEV